MLEARGLTKCYASLPAVSNVSFTIGPGQVLGYLGPNGSGKSTTVKMITGMMEPTSGQVLFHGLTVAFSKIFCNAGASSVTSHDKRGTIAWRSKP